MLRKPDCMFSRAFCLITDYFTSWRNHANIFRIT